ncbi:MAG TPA: APC family permease, partial [Ktedonobacterales bacterium]|nr:APC family permease [Ktedonobacterales bacterium]
VVGASYWQTIHAYPHGGGSYIVARDNLGDWPGLIAAAALLIDYILTVSVSVTAGVDALVTAKPSLSGLSVPLGVFFILFIMVVNLRGVRESGSVFAAPTYLFIAAFGIMIVTGVIHALLTHGGLFNAIPPRAVDIHKTLGWTPNKFGVVLVLTAFASGCSAMTGVEAISNGVPAFKRPEADNAARTLIWMIGILVTLFVGVTYLAWRFGIEPYQSQNPTVDGQIAHMLFTGSFGWFYYVIQIATLLILVLAANTSFADFPRLSSILARDGFMPHQFSFRGDRLAFTTGIVVLSLLSIVLLVAFNGNTDALINLYALGVFTAFTLSQTGMVIRWRRLRQQGGSGWRRSMVINTVGAIVTGIVAIVIIVTKFDRGAWIVVLLVPMLVFMFRGISHHYAKVREQTVTATPLHAEELHHIAIVPIGDLNRPAVQSLAYARSITPEVVAVHVATDDEDSANIQLQWEKLVASRRDAWERLAAKDNARLAYPAASALGMAAKPRVSPMPQLVIIESPFRSMVKPLVSYIDAMRDANPSATISVVLPEYVPAHFWERILHNQTAPRLKLALYYHPSVVVINVPYHLPR